MPGVEFTEQASPEFPEEAIRSRTGGPCRVTVSLERSGPPTSVGIETCPEVFVEASLQAARDSRFFLVQPKNSTVTAQFVVEYPFEWHAYRGDYSFLQLTAPKVTNRIFVAGEGPHEVATPPFGTVKQGKTVSPRYPQHARRLEVEGGCAVTVRVGTDGVPDEVYRRDCADVFYPNASAAALRSRLDVAGLDPGETAEFTFKYQFLLRPEF